MNLFVRYRLPLFGAAEAGTGPAGGGGAAGGAPAGGADPAKAAGNGADTGPWYAPFKLPKEDSDYIEGKGAKDLATLVKTTRDLDGLARGRNVIAKPDPAKVKEWEGWKELGWEPDPKKYAIKPPEEGKYKFERDNALWDTVQKVAHENRVPVAAAQAMHDAAMEHWGKLVSKVEDDGAKARAETMGALRGEWGLDFDANMERGKRAATQLAGSVGVEDFKALQEAVGGAPQLLKMFAKLGEQLSEDTLKTGQSTAALTPATARAERLRLEADPIWLKSLKDERDPQHRSVVARRMQLLELEAKAAG